MTYRAEIMFKFRERLYGATVDVDWEWVDDSIDQRSDGYMYPYLQKVVKVVSDEGLTVRHILGMDDVIQSELETLEPPEPEIDASDLEDVMS